MPTLCSAERQAFVFTWRSGFPRKLNTCVVADPADAIKAAIAEKQRKAQSYQWGGAQERWLLIYAAGEGLADMAAVLKDSEVVESHPFTQIFLWDKFSETIHCVSPKFVVVLERGKTLYVKRLPPCVQPYLKPAA